MSGTLVFKPVEARLSHDTELFTKMDPYVQILIGDKTSKGEVCHSGGKTPKWQGSISANRHHEHFCLIEVRDKDSFTSDDIIGVGKIDLKKIEAETVSAEWYPLYYKKKPAGEILIQVIWTPNQISSENNSQPENEHYPRTSHPHLGET